MSSEKADAIVLRTTDWSETSRIATLWTREFGKIRVVAKGGRRLRSNFESALDLLNCCRIVFLRKSSGSLDLLTEAQVIRTFPHLRKSLSSLYGAYYVAELLTEFCEEYDPHPALFDEVLRVLGELGEPGTDDAVRVMCFELGFLRELGYQPVLDRCAGCGNEAAGPRVGLSPAAGGVLCEACLPGHRDRRPLSAATWTALREWSGPGDAGERRQATDGSVRAEARQLLGQYVTYLLGRRPRLLAYLGS